MIADPNFAKKLLTEREGTIAPCIGCMLCMYEYALQGKPVECTVNCTMGKEMEHTLRPAPKHKKVYIIGGGPAGMEAAQVSALRGHHVTLFDKKNELGGQMLLAAKPPEKTDITDLISYYKGQLSSLDVKVELNKDIDADFILRNNPDAVIIATGVIPRTPALQGIRKTAIVTAEDILSGTIKAGKSALILGGVGCETALFLVDTCSSLYIVEMLPALAEGVIMPIKMAMINKLNQRAVMIVTGASIEEVDINNIQIKESNGNTRTAIVDMIILATGSLSNQNLFHKLEGKIPDLHLIGDAVKPRRIKEAIKEGYAIACKL
jgi:2-enoate reductase